MGFLSGRKKEGKSFLLGLAPQRKEKKAGLSISRGSILKSFF
jgi:hypothetical protein